MGKYTTYMIIHASKLPTTLTLILAREPQMKKKFSVTIWRHKKSLFVRRFSTEGKAFTFYEDINHG